MRSAVENSSSAIGISLINDAPTKESMMPLKTPAVPKVAIKVGMPKPAIAIAFTPPSKTPITIARIIGIKRLSPFNSNFCMITTAAYPAKIPTIGNETSIPPLTITINTPRAKIN